MFHRYAMNAKRVSEKKLFDAEKARRRLEQGSKKWKESRDPQVKQDRYEKMKKALEGYTPVFHRREA